MRAFLQISLFLFISYSVAAATADTLWRMRLPNFPANTYSFNCSRDGKYFAAGDSLGVLYIARTGVDIGHFRGGGKPHFSADNSKMYVYCWDDSTLTTYSIPNLEVLQKHPIQTGSRLYQEDDINVDETLYVTTISDYDEDGQLAPTWAYGFAVYKIETGEQLLRLDGRGQQGLYMKIFDMIRFDSKKSELLVRETKIDSVMHSTYEFYKYDIITRKVVEQLDNHFSYIVKSYEGKYYYLNMSQNATYIYSMLNDSLLSIFHSNMGLTTNICASANMQYIAASHPGSAQPVEIYNTVTKTDDYLSSFVGQYNMVFLLPDLSIVAVNPLAAYGLVGLSPTQSIESDTKISSNETVVLPNPVSSSLTVNMPSTVCADIELTVYGLDGKEYTRIHLQKQDIINSKYDVDVSSLQAGRYFLRVSNCSSTVSYQFIKE